MTILIGAVALAVSLVIVFVHGGWPTQSGQFQALLLLMATAAMAAVIVGYRHLRKVRIPIQSDEEIEKKVEDKVEKKMDKWLG